MAAIKEMNEAFKMMLDPEYAEKPAAERSKIRKAAKGKIVRAEKIMAEKTELKNGTDQEKAKVPVYTIV